MADAADVVVSLAYADATALSQARSTRDAVSRRLVQVRGHLSLSSPSAMLAAAASARRPDRRTQATERANEALAPRRFRTLRQEPL